MRSIVCLLWAVLIITALPAESADRDGQGCGHRGRGSGWLPVKMCGTSRKVVWSAAARARFPRTT